jgi:hypothetical protein
MPRIYFYTCHIILVFKNCFAAYFVKPWITRISVVNVKCFRVKKYAIVTKHAIIPLEKVTRYQNQRTH